MKESFKQAQKVHACAECLRPIQPGEVYQQLEHRARIWRVCQPCATLWEEVLDRLNEGPPYYPSVERVGKLRQVLRRNPKRLKGLKL